MSAQSALQRGIAVLMLLCSQRPSLASEPAAADADALPSASAPDRQGAAARTLRVLVDGNRLRILREEHTGTATLATLNLPAPARDTPLLLGRAAYLPLEGMGVVVEPREPPPSQWTHLTGASGARLVRDPVRIVGAIFAGVGGGVALISALGLTALYIPIGTVGSIGDDRSRTAFGTVALVGLSVGLLGGIVAIAAKDQWVQGPASN